jgi:cytochrome b subunit of formate dehydrogenase
MSRADDRTLGMVERMTLCQRVIHGVLILAILMLVLSGLALAYHGHDWAHALIAMMGGFGGRAFVHRAGAVLLLLVAVYHLVASVVSARYQRDLRSSVPRPADVKAGWAGFLYRTLGRGEPPKYGHYTPSQKFQYWLIVLGLLVMSLSGAVLWSPKASLELFPKSFSDLMLVIHSSQAQFAFILLIAWHLWDVHLAGGNFPMNPAWLTGKMREDLFRAQHGAEWDDMRKGTKE